MDIPFFSLIVPIYNTDLRYLSESLDSFLDQKYEYYEIILVDDGSNQETRDYLDKLDNPLIKVIRQDNQGQYLSRLNGARYSKGNYLWFVDSDDLIKKDILVKFKDILTENPVDMIFFGFSRFRENINNIAFSLNNFTESGYIEKEKVVEETLKYRMPNVWSKVISRKIFRFEQMDVNTDLRKGEDFIQATDFVLQANSFYYLNESVYFYRINELQRSYYIDTKFDEINCFTPIYDMAFKQNNYQKYLSAYKLSVANAVSDKALRICLMNISYKNKKQYLDKLNENEVVSLTKSINTDLPLVSNILFKIVISKNYCLLNLLSKIYKYKIKI